MLVERLGQVRLNKQATSPAVVRDGRLFKNRVQVNRNELDDFGNFDYGGTG